MLTEIKTSDWKTSISSLTSSYDTALLARLPSSSLSSSLSSSSLSSSNSDPDSITLPEIAASARVFLKAAVAA